MAEYEQLPKIDQASDIAIRFDIRWLIEILLKKRLKGLLTRFRNNCFLRAVRMQGVVFRILLEHRDEFEFKLSRDTVR